MTKQNKTAVAKTAHGKVLDTPVSYTFSWEDYDTHAELVAANDTLTNDEVVKVRNTERQNNARQKALTAALDAAGIQRPTLEDPQFRLRKMFDIFKANGLSDADAKVAASNALTIEWDE